MTTPYRTATLLRDLVLIQRDHDTRNIADHCTTPCIETISGLIVPTECQSGNNLGVVVNHGPLAKCRNGDLVLYPDAAIVQPVAELDDEDGDYVLYACSDLFIVVEPCRVEP